MDDETSSLEENRMSVMTSEESGRVQLSSGEAALDE